MGDFLKKKHELEKGAKKAPDIGAENIYLRFNLSKNA